MGWSLIQSAIKAATSTAAGSAAVAYGTNLTAGTKLLAAVATDTQSGTTDTVATVKDAAGNSFTLIGHQIGPTTGNILTDVSLWAIDTPSGDAGTKPTITATLSAGTANISILVQEVSGLATGSTTAAMIDGTLAGLTGTATGSTGSPSYSSSEDGEYLVSVYGDSGGPITWTAPAALTADANSLNSSGWANIALAYGNSTDGAEAGSWSLTGTATQWATLLVAFQLAGGGGNRTATQTVAVTQSAAASIPGGGGSGAGGLQITSLVLPTGQVSQSYSAVLTAMGGTGTGYTWSVSSGSMPDGLSLASSGAVSGTPSAAGTGTVTVEVTDSASNTATQVLDTTVITGPEGSPAGGPYQLAWADEFNVAYPTPYGTGPDPNVWSDHYSSGDLVRVNNTNEQEWYPHGYYGHSVAGSVWTSTTVYQNPQSIDPTCPDPLQSGGVAGTFTSAMISGHLANSAFTYGYIEARVQQPAPASSWSAIWMVARAGIWPPEIDIAEWQNSLANAGKNDSAYDNLAGTWQDAYYTGDTSYHIWGCSVTSSTVTVYRDGTEVFSAAYDGHAFPWFPIGGNAVEGATSGSGYPDEWNCDYIRIFTPTGVPAAPTITAISPADGIASGGDVTVTFTTVSGATSYRVTAQPTDQTADNFPNDANGYYLVTGTTSPLTVTGLPSGVRFNFTACAINSTGYSLESAPAGPAVINIQLLTTVLPDATTGAPYSQTLAAQAGNPPWTWSVASGSLPAGLSLGASTGIISGTPTGSGTSSFTIEVAGDTDWSGGATAANSAQQALAITVGSGGGGGGLSITTDSLPGATVGVAYSGTLVATGGTTPYVWSISSGSLPPWASLDPATGIISGTPIGGDVATTDFTVQVTDAASPATTATQSINASQSAAATSSSGGVAQPDGPTGTWTLAWNDEFDGTSGMSGESNGLDRSKWNVGWYYGPSSPGGEGYDSTSFTASSGGGAIEFYGPGALSFPSGGGMELSCFASGDGPDGASYDSGGHSSTYESGGVNTAGLMNITPDTGYSVPSDIADTVIQAASIVIEVECQMPGPSICAGSGTDGAYWTYIGLYDCGDCSTPSYPDSGTWTEEIDIWEAFTVDGSTGSDYYTTFHAASSYGSVVSCPSSMASTDLSLAMHKFTVEFTYSSMKAWVDGVAVSTISPTSAECEAQWAVPQYLNLQLQLKETYIATGATYEGSVATPWTVNYVRVFTQS